MNPNERIADGLSPFGLRPIYRRDGAFPGKLHVKEFTDQDDPPEQMLAGAPPLMPKPRSIAIPVKAITSISLRPVLISGRRVHVVAVMFQALHLQCRL